MKKVSVVKNVRSEIGSLSVEMENPQEKKRQKTQTTNDK